MLNATISKKIEITPELIRLFIKPDTKFQPFRAGQYVAIGLPGNYPRPAHFPPEKEQHAPDKIIKRAYSIGSAPDILDELEFYIAIVPDGGLTSRLALVKEGDRIFIAPKITGTFTLDSVPEGKNLFLISTGTGLAPFVAMLKSPETLKKYSSIHILHGVRYEKDLAYKDELIDFTQRFRNKVFYYPVVSREKWSGRGGHVQKIFENGEVKLNPENDHVFLCGNPAMIDSLEKLLTPLGYSEHTRRVPGNMHLERYW
jgi:ferredoxin--NADP+ reductase